MNSVLKNAATHASDSGYTVDMKKTSMIALYIGFTLAFAQAQTLGEALTSVEESTQEIVSRQSAQSWGQQTAADDLNRLLAQTRRMSEAMNSDDARQIEDLQRGLSTAARRVDTSSVLLDETERQHIQEILKTVAEIDSRLTELRLRFGGQASMVPGSLNDVALYPAEPLDGVYTNLEQLLIDVRDARRLAATLGNRRFPAWGIMQGGLDNLDPLQLDRFRRAGWELERELSGSVVDISQTYDSWNRFATEYDRLGYMGIGTNVRQLERVMNRLSSFYSDPEL